MSRQRINRKIKRQIVFFVEGESEQRYFRALIKKYRLTAAKVMLLNNSGHDYVDKAINGIQKKAEIETDAKVYLVFDVDKFNNQNSMEQIVAKAVRRHFLLGISNECFEVWLLAHYQKLNAHKITQTKLKTKLSTWLDQPYKKADVDQLQLMLDQDRELAAIENTVQISKIGTLDCQFTTVGGIVAEVISHHK